MKKIFLLLLLVLSSNVMVAQGYKNIDKGEKIKALMVTHISKDLNLSAQEAEKFWPVFHESKKRLDELQLKKRTILRDIDGKLDALSDADAQKYISLLDNLENEKITVETKAKNDIIKILGTKRYLILKNAEMTFRRTMLEEFRERRNKRG